MPTNSGPWLAENNVIANPANGEMQFVNDRDYDKYVLLIHWVCHYINNMLLTFCTLRFGQIISRYLNFIKFFTNIRLITHCKRMVLNFFTKKNFLFTSYSLKIIFFNFPDLYEVNKFEQSFCMYKCYARKTHFHNTIYNKKNAYYLRETK